MVTFDVFKLSDSYKKELRAELKIIKQDRKQKGTGYWIVGEKYQYDSWNELELSIYLWCKIFQINPSSWFLGTFWDDENKLAVVFGRKSDFDQFKQFFGTNKFSRMMFEKLPRRSIAAHVIYDPRCPHVVNKELVNRYIWTSATLTGQVYLEDKIWFFENEEDAIAFKLKWIK